MTDKEMRPEYDENDEPLCKPACPRHGLNGGGCWEGVRYCPPALRRDRDDLNKKYNALQKYTKIKEDILSAVDRISKKDPAFSAYLRQHLHFDGEKLEFMYSGDPIKLEIALIEAEQSTS